MRFSVKVIGIWAICAVMPMAGSLRAQDAPGDEGNPPDDSASFQTFYDSLGNQGSWIQSGDYGYVWQPTVNDPDWAPYTNGRWVYTDAGWTWVSDEPWGWATYHYGRWVNLDGTGWCWVPGYVWAPAWVSWRYGDDYCGWAPLPPDSFVGIDYGDAAFFVGFGFHIGGDCDDFFGIGAGCYHFVPVGCLGYRNYHGYYVNRHDNFAIINHTTNVTNINFSKNAGNNLHAVTIGGPSLAQVNAVTQTPVPRVNLVHLPQARGGGIVANNSLALFAPRISSQASQTAKPSFVASSMTRAEVNRGTDITRPLAVNQRLVPSSPTAQQIQQAHLAQAGTPASAKVMTAQTPFRPTLNTPLTSLKPVTAAPASTARGFQNGPEVHGNPSFNPGAASMPGTFQPSNRPQGGVTHVDENPSAVHSPPFYTPQSVTPSAAPQTGAPHGSGPGGMPHSGGYQHSSGGGGGGGESHGGNGQGGNNQQKGHG
jgi:hypothetical protein